MPNMAVIRRFLYVLRSSYAPYSLFRPSKIISRISALRILFRSIVQELFLLDSITWKFHKTIFHLSLPEQQVLLQDFHLEILLLTDLLQEKYQPMHNAL